MDHPDVQVIRGYELREKIGEGGFGAVYRAFQPAVGRDVALKAILPDYANQPEFILRFESEAQMVARLEHPHIVPLYDYWREPSGAYLVMRWLRGGSLASRIKKGQEWDLNAIARLIDQITDALMTAHRNGVIHRDLKPDNILLDENNNAYLADFGIAKDLRGQTYEDPADTLVGSLPYATPEQILNDPVTPQTDLYGLGVVVYELITGLRPFNDILTITSLVEKHLYEPLPSLKLRKPNLEHLEAIDAFILSATEKKPEHRFADALSMAAAFRAIVAGKQAAKPEPAIQVQNPYKGLRAFQQADEADFFGREDLIKRLLMRMGQSEDANRFLAIIGPSGSGKSSLVQAGLIPAIRRGALPGSDRWFVVEMTPGSDPVRELGTALLSITTDPSADLFSLLRRDSRGLLDAVKQILPTPDSELVLFIDQFEEVFTLADNEPERGLFLDNLFTAVSDPQSQLRLIITLRADYYDRPLLYANFGDLMVKRTEVVLPMSPAEFERAIIGPAERVGLRLEPRLAETIIRDVGQQPGALPLLQYALTELFERRDKSVLLLDAYRSSGGVLGALGRRANELFTSLNPASQEACRQLFLRLVTPGEGTNDTRRRILQSEALSIGDGQTMALVIDLYSKYRLLTSDRDPITRSPTIEVAHEALIGTWDRLRGWLDGHREDLRMHRRLATAANEWANAHCESSYLATGARLDQFETWARESSLLLNQLETDYLQSSVKEREARSAADRERKAQELKIARRAQTFERAAAVLAVIGILAVLATIMAITQAADAGSRVNAAEQTLAPVPVTLTSVAKHIDEQQTRLESLRLSSEAIIILQTEGGNAETAALLAVRALKDGYNPQADSSLVRAISATYTQQIYMGHTDRLLGAAYSPDGHLMVTGSRDKTARLWDVQTGKEIRQFTGHTDAVNSVAFSPDGHFILTGSTDKTVRLWDVQTGKEIRQFTGHTDIVESVQFSPDGQTVLTGSDDTTARLWDVQTGKEIRQFTGHTAIIETVAFSPDGLYVLTGGTDRTVRLWDVQTGKEIRQFKGIAGEIDSVAFSPDGKTMLTGARDSTTRLWDVQTGKEIRQFVGHTDYVRSVQFSPDGLTVLTGSRDRTARLWDVQTGKEIRQFTAHSDVIQKAVFSPDGKGVLTASWDNTARLWNAQMDVQPRQFIGHTDATVTVAFSPDQRYIVTGSVDKTARLWDVQTGQEIRRFAGHTDAVWNVAFSPDGRYLLTGSRDKTARLWDVQTGQELRRYVGHTGVVYSVAFSPDGRYVLTGSGDSTARLWDVNTGQEIRRFTGHTKLIWTAAFFPDGKRILTSSFDKTVRLWDVETGKEISEFTGHTDSVLGAAISPDGLTVLSGGSDRIGRLWDVETGKEIREFVGHTDALVNVAFSPDGRYVVTGSQDKTAVLWDVQTGQALRQFGRTGIVNSVKFSPDGRYVVTARFNRQVQLWDTDYRDLIPYACSRLFRDFTPDQRLQYGLPANDPTCPQFGVQTPLASVVTPFATPVIPSWTPIPTPTPEAF